MSPDPSLPRRLLLAAGVCALVFLLFFAVRSLNRPAQGYDATLRMSSYNSGSSGTMALKEFLDRSGARTRSLADPLRKASFTQGDVLLIVEPERPFTKTEMGLVDRTAAAGVTVVVFSEFDYKLASFIRKSGTSSSWFEQVGASGKVLRTSRKRAKTRLAADRPDWARDCGTLLLPGGKIFRDPAYARETAAYGWKPLLGTANGPVCLARKTGRGRIVLCSDSQFLSNRYLASNDNAVFAYRLLKSRGDGRILFEESCHGFEKRYTIAYFLGSPGPRLVVLQGLILLLLLVAAASVRFGRLRERRDETEDRIHFLNEGMAKLMNRRKYMDELFGLMLANGRRLLRRSPPGSAPGAGEKLKKLEKLEKLVRTAGPGRVRRKHVVALNEILSTGKEAVWP